MMIEFPVKLLTRRALGDVITGLAIFMIFAGALSGVPRLSDLLAMPAHAGELAKAAAHSVTISTPAVVEVKATAPSFMVEASAKQPGRAIALTVLAGVFTALFAFNLAFFRHLRRAYASPRRGGRRRDFWSISRGGT